MLGSMQILGGTPLQAAAHRQSRHMQSSSHPLRVVADVEAYPETRNRPKASILQICSEPWRVSLWQGVSLGMLKCI